VVAEGKNLMRVLWPWGVQRPTVSGGVYGILGWLLFALVVSAHSVGAQQIMTPAEPTPISPGPPPSPQERLLSPIPQRFDWINRDVRPNPLLESLLGQQAVRPQLLMTATLAEDYFSNFNQDSGGDGGEEYRTSLTLGTVYRLEKDRGFVSLANTITGNYEARGQDGNIGYANLALNMGYELPRVSLALSDSLVRSDDITQVSTGNIREGRETFTRNSVSPQIRYAFSRLTSVTLAYTNTIVVNEGEGGNTEISHAITTGLQHRFSQRLSADLHYGFTTRDDEEDAKSQTHTVGANLEYVLTRQTNFLVQGDSTYINRIGGGADSLVSGISLGVRHRFSGFVDLFAAAGAVVTDLDGQALRADPRWQASLNMILSPQTSLLLATQGDVRDTGGEVDNVGLELHQSVDLTLTQSVARIVHVSLSAGYVYTELLSNAGTTESDSGRKDHYWRADAGATYDLSRMWSLSLHYQYQRRDSNRDEDDFDAHQVTLAVSGSFPLL
jgi:predicted porin